MRLRQSQYVVVYRQSRCRGISLLEIIIALAIIGVFLSLSMRMSALNLQKARGMQNAESLLAFREMVIRFYTNNMEGMLQAMADGTGSDKYCRIAAVGYDNSSGVFSGGYGTFDNATHTCAFDAVVLKYKGMWPFEVPNANKPRWIAIFKRVYENATTPTNDVSVLFVYGHGDGAYVDTNIKKGEEELLAAKDVLGEFGGFAKKDIFLGCNTTKACGPSWKVNLQDYNVN
jgi:prepilin-type N-terminal cleavage/methylation domain-containing protein